MAVQISNPGYQPRMRLDTPPVNVYFPQQTTSGSLTSESFTTPPPTSQRFQAPVVVPGIAPPSKSISLNAPSSLATGPLGSFDGRRMRSKAASRRTVDYNASLINYVQVS